MIGRNTCERDSNNNTTRQIGLYRIYFLPILQDLEWQMDFQIDYNFTNLMCKTLQMYKWFEFLIVFCGAVNVTTFLISGFLTYLGLLD